MNNKENRVNHVIIAYKVLTDETKREIKPFKR